LAKAFNSVYTKIDKELERVYSQCRCGVNAERLEANKPINAFFYFCRRCPAALCAKRD